MRLDELINEIKHDCASDYFFVELYKKGDCVDRTPTKWETLLQAITDVPIEYRANFYIEYNKRYGSDRAEISYIQCMSKNDFDECCYFICREYEKISIL